MILTVEEFKFQYALGTLSNDTLEDIALSCSDDEVLRMLSKDENSLIRYYVASNPNTSLQILKELSEDKDWNIKRRARKYKIERIDNLAHDIDAKII